MSRSAAKSQFVLFCLGLTRQQKAAVVALSARTLLPESTVLRAAVSLALSQPDIPVTEAPWDIDVSRFEIFTSRITPDQRRGLAALSRKRGLSRASITRAALDRVLAKPELIAQVRS